MLIEFSVGNYKSFKGIETFSMVASKITSKDKKLDTENIFSVDEELFLLKSTAIYGANASGKSNLIKAIGFMRWFVRNSSKDTQAAEAIDVEPFRLDLDTPKEPSFFQVVFLLENKKYRYGFELDEHQVISEWLFHVPTIREARLFVRESGEFRLSPDFKEGKGLEDKTRTNALFLSVAAQFNGGISTKILNWFESLATISGLDDVGYRGYTLQSFESNEHRDSITQFVKKLDLGIEDIQVEKARVTEDALPKGLPEDLRNFLLRTGETNLTSITTFHWKYDSHGNKTDLEEFDIKENESEGTQKLFYLAGPLIQTIKNGEILFIDELDARLHPLITCEIVKLFNSSEINQNNAQLIFTTHDTNLLSKDMFRRDQVWFAEKDRYGASHLYSLVEYKPTPRNDASFEENYIQGKYGAIPYIGNLKHFLSSIND